MLIHVGFEAAFDFSGPTAVVLMPYIHPSRVNTIRRPERLTIEPRVPVGDYTDVYGNRCGRAVVGAGRVTIGADAIVEDDGRPDVQVCEAYQHGVHELPDDVLLFPAGQLLLRGRQRTARHHLVAAARSGQG